MKNGIEKYRLAIKRNRQKEDGLFDGRFKTKIIKSKKIYNRKKIKINGNI